MKFDLGIGMGRQKFYAPLSQFVGCGNSFRIGNATDIADPRAVWIKAAHNLVSILLLNTVKVPLDYRLSPLFAFPHLK
jgi:hypothetical protein